MARPQRVEPSGCGGPTPLEGWLTRKAAAWAAPTRHQPAARWANEARRQDGDYHSPRPPGRTESALAGPARVLLGGQKKPRRVGPAGVVSSNSSREHQGTMSRWTRMRRP